MVSQVDVSAEIHGYSLPDAVPISWGVGREHVARAETFWLSTIRPNNTPHVTPLIAVWVDGAIWFTTGPAEVKAQNLAENPACILTTGASDLVAGALDVVLEGTAERVGDDMPELEAIASSFADKYGTSTWHFTVRDGVFAGEPSGDRVLLFRVRPVRGLGFRKGDEFSQTTWGFPE